MAGVIAVLQQSTRRLLPVNYCTMRRLAGVGRARALPFPRSRADASPSVIVSEASEGAWRWPCYQLFDAHGRLVCTVGMMGDVVPAESYGPLPPPLRLRTALTAVDR